MFVLSVLLLAVRLFPRAMLLPTVRCPVRQRARAPRAARHGCPSGADEPSLPAPLQLQQQQLDWSRRRRRRTPAHACATATVRVGSDAPGGGGAAPCAARRVGSLGCGVPARFARREICAPGGRECCASSCGKSCNLCLLSGGHPQSMEQQHVEPFQREERGGHALAA
eukprot:scaffold4386_cov105-Isochrysis_galbana.AAC.4